MIIQFNTHGNEKQKEVARLWADSVTEDILYGGSKGSGKSFLGVSLIFGDAYTYPGTFYFIARKSRLDLVRFTMPSVTEVMQIWRLKEGTHYTYNGQYHYYTLHNGSRVYLLEARYLPTDKDYTRFGSMQMTRGWIEEGGEFHRDAKTNLQASVGRWKNEEYGLAPKLLITCNPANNFLYSDYYKPDRDNKLPVWRRFVKALPADNKCLPKTYVPMLLRTLTSAQIERLVYGNWEYDSDPTWLVDYDAVCDMFTNDWIEETGAAYISTDLAGKGRDKWVVGSWKGMTVRFPVVQAHSRGKEIEEKLHRLSTALQVPRSSIVSDADGLGFFLESYLEGIKEFHGGASSTAPQQYANLKTECAFKLAELINKREIRIICTPEIEEQIKQELGVLKMQNTNAAEQKAALITKDTMKDILGHSPDFLDVLIMRMVFEVGTKAEGMQTSEIQIPEKR